jgi:hypothetical protein
MREDIRGKRALVIAHHHPGRLRVRSRAFESDAPVLEATERWLAEQPGVVAVRVHGATGSVLVAYDPLQTDAGELLSAIAAHARLFMDEPVLSGAPAQRLYDAARALDDRIFRWSEGRVGLGLVIPIALAAGSVGSLLWSAHRRVPRWDNLLYWAVQFFRALNHDAHAHWPRHASDG